MKSHSIKDHSISIKQPNNVQDILFEKKGG